MRWCWRNSGSAFAALPASLLAQIEYEEGRVTTAEALLHDRLPVIARAGNIECAIRAYRVLARASAQRGQLNYAMAILQEAESLGEKRDWPRLVAASLGDRIDLSIRHGQGAEAENLADRLSRLAARRASRDGVTQREIEWHAALGRCRVALARGPAHSVLASLRQLEYEAASRKNMYLRLQVELHMVDVLMGLGDVDEALGILIEALEFGAIAGLCSSFLEGGAGVGAGLRLLHDSDLGTGDGVREILPYVGSLLGQGARRGPAAAERPVARSSSQLSSRERDILRLAGTGLSNKEIAKSLEIAPETVKSYFKQIFVKLGAGTRAEAVSKAQGLGLI